MTTTDRPTARHPRLPLPTTFTAPPPARTRPTSTVDLVHPRRPRHDGRALAGSLVDCAVYSQGLRAGGREPVETALKSAREVLGGFVWIGLHEPNAASLRVVADEFGLHPLAVEDALYAHQRPKLERHGDTLFVVLKTVHYEQPGKVIRTGELMIFVGPDFVVTVRHGAAGDLSEVRRDLEARPELLRLGPAAVLYAVVDRVVDGYAPAVHAMQDDVEETEVEVFSADREQPTERIYKLTREVMEFRRSVEPLVPVTAKLASGSLPGLDPRAGEFFRDIQDHVERANDQVLTMVALLTSVLSANLAQVAVRQNEDVRKISAWVAIVAVSTLIAGIYGMNFEYMPELGWAFGYPFALSLMVASSLLLYRGFKRNHWL